LFETHKRWEKWNHFGFLDKAFLSRKPSYEILVVLASVQTVPKYSFASGKVEFTGLRKTIEI